MDFSEFFSPSVYLKGYDTHLPVWHILSHLNTILSQYPLGTIASVIPEEVDLQNSSEIYIEKGVVVEKFTTIKGPCVICKGSTIRQSAYVREGSFIGPGSMIGHSTEVKGSFLFEGVQAAHFAYIGDSIVGKNALLGAGVVFANVRLDKKEIHLEGKPTGRKKLGAILGDFSQIGCNSVINPGSFLKKHSKFPPLSCIKSSYASY